MVIWKLYWADNQMGAVKNNPTLWVASLAARWLPLSIKRLFYRSPMVARLIRRQLNRAAPPGLTPVQVAGGPLAGKRLILDLQTEKDYWLGTYEPELTAAMTELVLPEKVAYDLGANIGYISLLLAQAVGEKGRVYAFEALPANIERLRANISLNELGQRIEVVEGAVGDTTAPVAFLVGPSGGTGKAQGSAGRQELDYRQTILVQGIVLDEFVYTAGNPPPQVVKMDIEGGEVLALPGMRRILTEARPLIFLELHGQQSARVAWEVLGACGYRLCRMAPGYPAVATLDTLGWKSYLVGKPNG